MLKQSKSAAIFFNCNWRYSRILQIRIFSSTEQKSWWCYLYSREKVLKKYSCMLIVGRNLVIVFVSIIAAYLPDAWIYFTNKIRSVYVCLLQRLMQYLNGFGWGISHTRRGQWLARVCSARGSTTHEIVITDFVINWSKHDFPHTVRFESEPARGSSDRPCLASLRSRNRDVQYSCALVENVIGCGGRKGIKSHICARLG